MGDKKLTPKQLHFARCIASGMTQSDGYREAYAVRPLTTQESVHSSASRLMSNPTVASRVNHLIRLREQAVVASAVTDRERVLSKLRGWMDSAEPADSVKLRAAELLGKSANLFATEVTVADQKDSSSLAAELESLLLAANEATQSVANESAESVTNDNEQLH
jgi:hypothetical protein